MAGGNIKLLPEVELLTEKLLADPKSRIFAQLADAYRKSDLIDEAIDTAKKGLEQHPKYAIAHLILGRCYLAKGMYALAREEFELTIKNDPQNLVGYKLLGETFEKQNMHPEALKYYQMVLDIDPADIELSEKVTNLKNLQSSEPEIASPPAEKIEPTQATQKESESMPPAESSAIEDSGDEISVPLPEVLVQEPAPGIAEEKNVVPARIDAEEIPLPPVLAEEPKAEDITATGLEKISADQQFVTPSAEEAVTILDESKSKIPDSESQGPTSTLAEIYVQQGFMEKAIDIYKELIASQPENETYKNRIDELLTIAYPEERHNIIEPIIPAEEIDNKTAAKIESQKPEPTTEITKAGHPDADQSEYPFSQMFAEMEKAVAPEPSAPPESFPEPIEAKEEPVIAVLDSEKGTLDDSTTKTDSEPVSMDFGALFNDYNQPPAEKESPEENTKTSEIAPEKKSSDPADNSEGDDTVNSFQSWLSNIKK